MKIERRGVRCLLLLGLALFLALAAVVAGVVIPGQSTETEDVPPSLPISDSGVTALQAVSPAISLAAEWREDARLAGGFAQWREVGIPQAERDPWSFQFFSPSSNRVALVVVSEGEPRLIRDSRSPYSVPTFSKEGWRVDSDKALEIWLREGGSHLVEQRPDTQLVMRLRGPKEESSAPFWTIVGRVPGHENVFTVMVNATTGDLMEQR